MFTIDARCDQCHQKETCQDRTTAIPALSTLANSLNAPEMAASPGDGKLIFFCAAFAVA